MSVTREAIRLEAGKRLRILVSGVATGGTTATLVAANVPIFYAASGLDDTLYEGNWILPTSGDEDGNARLITDFAPTTGTFTVTPAWSTGPASADTFEIHKTIYPTDLNDCIERALRKMRHIQYYPLSLLVDPDMETSGVTNRTDVNATPTKDTDAADVGDPLAGSQSLQVATSAANGYSRETTLVKVESGKSYSLWAKVRADGAFTAVVDAYDETNGASIDSETWDDNDWGIVDFSFTIPTACDEISVRLGAQENSATVHFNNAILQRSGRCSYDLPSWIDNPEADIVEVYEFSGTTPRSLTRNEIDYDILYDPTAATPQSILVDATAGSPVFVRAMRPFLAEAGTLADDAATTDAHFEWIVARTVILVLKLLEYQAPDSDTDAWRRLRADALREAQRQNRRWDPRAGEAQKVVV